MSTIAAFPVGVRRSAARRTVADRTTVRLRITRRGRLILTALVFLLALTLAALATSALDAPMALAGSSGEDSVTITVAPGDTLWDYADQYAPEGTDPRDYVLLVERENDLTSERLVAGTTIELPVGSAARG